MTERRKYRKRAKQVVHAICLDLDFDGFTYRKWDDTQRCKKGDWLVDNGGDVYTVNAATFAKTYRRTPDGTYEKVAPVWAAPAATAGAEATQEGTTRYKAGDYLVSNNEDGTDSYAIEKAKFEQMYEAVD